MGLVPRVFVLLGLLCLIGAASGERLGTAVQSAERIQSLQLHEATEPSTDASSTEEASDSGKETSNEDYKEKYEQVLEELQKQPQYLSAREANDADAEDRRERIDKYLSENPDGGRRVDPVRERARSDYEEVLDELESNPRFKEARRRLGGYNKLRSK